MRDLLLKRRVVLLLRKLNRAGTYPTMKEFLDLFEERRWPRMNYLSDSNERFRVRLEELLEECVGPDREKHFIDYHEDRDGRKPLEHLAVAPYGRSLLRLSGFIQIAGKDMSKTWAFIAWILSIIVTMVGMYSYYALTNKR